jgi:nucleoside-diphosphate-sugar epimerase
MGQHRPQAFFLCAAKVGGILANASYPAEFLYRNLIIEANIIKTATDLSCEKLLFLGCPASTRNSRRSRSRKTPRASNISAGGHAHPFATASPRHLSGFSPTLIITGATPSSALLELFCSRAPDPEM